MPILIQVINLRRYPQVDLFGKRNMQKIKVKCNKMCVPYCTAVNAFGIQVICSNADRSCHKVVWCEFGCKVTPYHIDFVSCAIRKQGAISEIQSHMHAGVHAELSFVKQLVPSPEKKGPWLSVQRKANIRVNRKPLSAK